MVATQLSQSHGAQQQRHELVREPRPRAALKRVLHDQPHPDANSKPLELVLARIRKRRRVTGATYLSIFKL